MGRFCPHYTGFDWQVPLGLTCPGQDGGHAPRHEQNTADQTHLRQQHLPPLAHSEHLGDDGFLGDPGRHGVVLMLLLIRAGHRRALMERRVERARSDTENPSLHCPRSLLSSDSSQPHCNNTGNVRFLHDACILRRRVRLSWSARVEIASISALRWSVLRSLCSWKRPCSSHLNVGNFALLRCPPETRDALRSGAFTGIRRVTAPIYSERAEAFNTDELCYHVLCASELHA